MKKIVSLVFLLLTVLNLCVMGWLNVQTVYASPYISIDVGTAYSIITNGSYSDLVVLDVRTQSEYDSGHICDAVWIPVTELEARINELTNHEIIVYCKSGGRSAIASEILDSNNFTKVYNMLGGIQAWQSAGYEIPEYTLIINSSPTGATFTVDNVSRSTPWSGTYCENTSVGLEMPKYHDGYVWSHWLEDGNPNRIKTVMIDTNITLTAVYEPAPSPAVGGKANPIDKVAVKIELQTPVIWLSTIILPLVATVVFVKLKKKKQ